MKNMIGYKFGRLTVLEWHGKNKQGNTWLCECDCGNKVVVRTADLNRGHTKSCGCLVKDNFRTVITKHGNRHTRLYSIWANMLSRCTNPKTTYFERYGGRGITVCEEWKNNFQAFYDWAIDNGYEESLTIDRIDNDKGYFPDNCRWATVSEQNSNTRRNHYITYNGKTQTITQWAEEIGIPARTLEARLNKRHWSVERALTTPKQR